MSFNPVVPIALCLSESRSTRIGSSRALELAYLALPLFWPPFLLAILFRFFCHPGLVKSKSPRIDRAYSRRTLLHLGQRESIGCVCASHHEYRRRICLQSDEVLDRPKLDLPTLTFVWRWRLSSSWFRKVSPHPAQIRNRGLTSSPSVLNSSRSCFHSDI